MKVSRILFRLIIVTASASALSFFSGCATTGKSSAKAAPSVSPPVTPETKPVPAPAMENSTPPTAVAPAPTASKPTPAPAAVSPEQPAAALPAVIIPVRHATIVGSQEASILLDNFTAFVSSVDGRKVETGRNGWNTPLPLDVGHRKLGVEFNRGVFYSKGQVEFEAVANTRYELKYATDAELFGKNSYCKFWVIEIETGHSVSLVSKAAVEKLPEPPKQSLLP